MLWTIISAVIAGLVIGVLARLVLPGRQSIGMLMTIILGVLGALIGSWISDKLIYHEDKTVWHPISFIIGVAVAAVLIAIYAGFTGRGSRAITRT